MDLKVKTIYYSTLFDKTIYYDILFVFCRQIKIKRNNIRFISTLKMFFFLFISVSFAKIITPVDTRWNSLLMMMRSILHLQLPLEAIKDNARDARDNPKLVELIPEQADFELLAKIVPLLTKFEAVSEHLSADQRPSISFVVPKLHYIQSHLFSLKVKKTDPEDRPLRELAEVDKYI